MFDLLIVVVGLILCFGLHIVCVVLGGVADCAVLV